MSSNNGGAEDFIPFSHSTPVSKNDWSQRQRYKGNLQMKPRFNHTWNHGSPGSPRHNNSSFNRGNSTAQEFDISAYLSPAMLQDPWEKLRQRDSNSFSGFNSTNKGNTNTFSDSVTPMPGNTPHSFGSMPTTSFNNTTDK